MDRQLSADRVRVHGPDRGAETSCAVVADSPTSQIRESLATAG